MAEKTSAGTAVPSESGHSKTFPPLDHTTFAPQLVWLAVSFGLLYLLLSRMALPRISEVIDERKERIQRDLGEAERLKGETEAALGAYEQLQAEARSKAQAIAKETRDRLTAQAERERQNVDARMAAKLAETEKQIGEMKARALAGVNEIAAGTVSAIVGKLIGQDATAEEVGRALSPSPGE